MRPLVRLAAAAAAVAIVASCGTSNATPVPSKTAGGPSVVPVIISTELAVGPNRILFSFLDATGNRPVAAPDRTAKIRFVGPDGSTADAPDGTFVWAIEGERGDYVTHASFPVPGRWQAQFTTSAPGAPTETISRDFDVVTKTSVAAVGQKAPSVDTPTLADVGGDPTRISTDDQPVKAFYETSEADALAAGKPFVIAFATPKFCASAQCGPTLDRLKPIAAAHPEVTFINVEPYRLQVVDGQLQPVLDAAGQLQAVPATIAFGLLSEPYVFVVGADGTIRASFEAVFSDAELERALADLG